MTRMPPEMSTTNTPTMTMPLPPTQPTHESLCAMQQTRSRFMINDILAGGVQQNNLPPTQQQLALQHYLSQQQQQQQQHHHQQQKQYFLPISTETQAALRHFPPQHTHLMQSNVYAPHAALMGLTPVGIQALQQQQQQQQRDNGTDFDERSRSPLPAATGSVNKMLNGISNNNNNNSFNDDQASTIDDSDSECIKII